MNNKTIQAEVLDFHPDLAVHFERLNRGWIEAYFEVVEADERVLSNPAGAIVDPGGAIVFVRDQSTAQILGTVALIKHGPATGEIAKMAVDERFRGFGLGRILGDAIIERARDRGMRKLFLETNSILTPALGLYQALGFKRIELDPDSEYQRADIRMALEIV